MYSRGSSLSMTLTKVIHTGLTCSLRNNAIHTSHRGFYLGALRSLTAKPASHVATITLTPVPFRALKGGFDPGDKRTWFLDLVPLTAPTRCAVFELLLPGFPWNLVKLFKEKLVYWKTPSFFQFAHKVLFNDFVVSRQGPLGVAHVSHTWVFVPRGVPCDFFGFSFFLVVLVLSPRPSPARSRSLPPHGLPSPSPRDLSRGGFRSCPSPGCERRRPRPSRAAS